VVSIDRFLFKDGLAVFVLKIKLDETGLAG
jgi:hypothetical protein